MTYIPRALKNALGPKNAEAKRERDRTENTAQLSLQINAKASAACHIQTQSKCLPQVPKTGRKTLLMHNQFPGARLQLHEGANTLRNYGTTLDKRQ